MKMLNLIRLQDQKVCWNNIEVDNFSDYNIWAHTHTHTHTHIYIYIYIYIYWLTIYFHDLQTSHCI